MDEYGLDFLALGRVAEDAARVARELDARMERLCEEIRPMPETGRISGLFPAAEGLVRPADQ